MCEVVTFLTVTMNRPSILGTGHRKSTPMAHAPVRNSGSINNKWPIAMERRTVARWFLSAEFKAVVQYPGLSIANAFSRVHHICVYVFCYIHGDHCKISLHWRHNDHDGVSNHQPHCLFTQPFIQTQIKENIKAPRHWPLCGEFTGTGEFPAQKASYAENVSIWWRHHVM